MNIGILQLVFHEPALQFGMLFCVLYRTVMQRGCDAAIHVFLTRVEVFQLVVNRLLYMVGTEMCSPDPESGVYGKTSSAPFVFLPEQLTDHLCGIEIVKILVSFIE